MQSREKQIAAIPTKRHRPEKNDTGAHPIYCKNGEPPPEIQEARKGRQEVDKKVHVEEKAAEKFSMVLQQLLPLSTAQRRTARSAVKPTAPSPASYASEQGNNKRSGALAMARLLAF